LEVGQHIFTPERTRDALTPALGARSNAGWLYVRDGIRMLHDRRQRELSVTLGVTGQPALAEESQRLFHAIVPGFNRPIDWSEQLAFEPGVIVSFAETGRVLARQAGRVGFDVLPRGELHAGNVNTSVEAGLRVRTGFGLAHPWMASAPDAGTEIVIAAGGATRYVARDLFLDGNTGSKGGVGHEPFVHRVEWSVALRRGAFAVGYGTVTQTRAYPAGPARHTWSALSVSIAPGAIAR
jgi:hypothetical protein